MLNGKQTYFDLTHVHVHVCERRIAWPNNTVPMKSTFKSTNGPYHGTCNEHKNSTKFQFYTEKAFRDVPFFVILHHFVSNM